jgi:hypothetical protein
MSEDPREDYTPVGSSGTRNAVIMTLLALVPILAFALFWLLR